MATEQENKVFEIALNYYEQLLPVIPVNEVLIKLLARRIINLDDKQLIKAEKTDRRQTEFLLDSYILKRTQSGEEDVFYTLLEVMYESGKCDSLVKKIYKDLGKSPPAASTPEKMSTSSIEDDDDSTEVASEVIANQRVLLSQKLSADDLMDYLIADRLVDDSVGEKLGMMCFTPMEKNRMIINSLSRGPPGTLKKFCAILRKVKKYSYIAEELEKERLKVVSQPGSSH